MKAPGGHRTRCAIAAGDRRTGVRKSFVCVAAVCITLAAAHADPGETDENGCHGAPDAHHCHGGGGASGASLLVMAAAVAGAAYLVRKALRRGQLKRAAEAPAPALESYDDNGNGSISCREARRHGIAPVARGHAAYPHMRDLDRDGIVCEGLLQRGSGSKSPEAVGRERFRRARRVRQSRCKWKRRPTCIPETPDKASENPALFRP